MRDSSSDALEDASRWAATRDAVQVDVSPRDMEVARRDWSAHTTPEQSERSPRSSFLV
jgi:hypothetical protein